MEELVQEKMLAMTKIQNGGVFSKMAAEYGTRFLGFAGKHSEMGDRSL